MAEGKTIAIVLLGIGLVISSVGFANYYLQSSLQNQQLSFLENDPSAITKYSTITSTSISAFPVTQTSTDFATTTSTQSVYLTDTTYSTTTSVTTLTTTIETVPSTTLLVTSDSYSNATKTVSMTVENTENYTVYAQFSATMYGNPCCGFGNTAGSYSSSVIQFNPLSATNVPFVLTQGNYYGDCVGYISSVQLSYSISGQSSPVSGSYTFPISPAFPSPYQNCP
jgi:hypothetical protein